MARKKESDEERWDAAKRKRAADKEARDAHLRGRPAPTEWDKGGVIKRLNPSQRAPMSRSDVRELAFKLGDRKRVEGTGDNVHSSAFTRPPLGLRRTRRRAADRIAKASRRRNRHG